MNHNANTQQERANTHLVRIARYRTNQTRLLMALKKLYIRAISIPVVFAHYISFYHNITRSPYFYGLLVILNMVAEAGFEPTTFGL